MIRNVVWMPEKASGIGEASVSFDPLEKSKAVAGATPVARSEYLVILLPPVCCCLRCYGPWFTGAASSSDGFKIALARAGFRRFQLRPNVMERDAEMPLRDVPDQLETAAPARHSHGCHVDQG